MIILAAKEVNCGAYEGNIHYTHSPPGLLNFGTIDRSFSTSISPGYGFSGSQLVSVSHPSPLDQDRVCR